MTYPQQWEYISIFLKGELMACLNKAGVDGWELCAILEKKPGEGHGVMMKRPKRLIDTDLTGAPKNLMPRPGDLIV